MPLIDSNSAMLPLPSGVEIADHALVLKGNVVGLLNPGILVGRCKDSRSLKILGPRGAVEARIDDPDSVALALFASGSVLPGDQQSVTAVQELLTDARTSRTASYVCCIVDHCRNVVSFFHRVRASSVCIAGCGGIGSLAACVIAGAGVKRLHLIDSDAIEESNFNRQLFWTKSDVGDFKVDVLARYLNTRHADLSIDVDRVALSPESIELSISRSDGVLFTADHPVGIARYGRDAAMRLAKPFVSCGYLLQEAVVNVTTDEESSTDLEWTVLSKAIMPSYGPSNVEIAGRASSLLLAQIGGIYNQDGGSMQWRPGYWARGHDGRCR